MPEGMTSVGGINCVPWAAVPGERHPGGSALRGRYQPQKGGGEPHATEWPHARSRPGHDVGRCRVRRCGAARATPAGEHPRVTFPSITNRGEFFSNHYLDAVMGGDFGEMRKAWDRPHI